LAYLTHLGVHNTQKKKKVIDNTVDITRIFDDIASKLTDETSRRLLEIASCDDVRIGIYPRLRLILAAFVADPQVVGERGVDCSRLVDNVNTLISKTRQNVALLTNESLNHFLKTHLIAYQISSGLTPILSYDDSSCFLSVIDAWTLFTLRRARQKVLDALMIQTR
jgi:hypothetical protein